MIRLLAMLTLLSFPATASDMVTYRACDQYCREFKVRNHSAAEITALRPKNFCYYKGLRDYEKIGVRKDGSDIYRIHGSFHGYFLVDDCRRMNNMAATDEWNYINPVLVGDK
jgi:hypothetical protein